MSLRFLAIFTLALAPLVSTCSSDPDPGTDCQAEDDCGSLACLCKGVRDNGVAGDEIPGVCSKQCSSKADCDSLGDDMSCVVDFCTGVNLCLQGYSGGETLP
jgi:hypothetical protein